MLVPPRTRGSAPTDPYLADCALDVGIREGVDRDLLRKVWSAEHLRDDVLGDGEARGRAGRWRVADARDAIRFGDPEVVDQRAVPLDRLGADADPPAYDVVDADRGHV